MPVYLVTTPSGSKRVVDAVSQKDAVDHVVENSYKTEAVGAARLAQLAREGYPIEASAKRIAHDEGAPDDGQSDIEDVIDAPGDSAA